VACEDQGHLIRSNRCPIQEVPVFIAIVDFETAAADRATALDLLDAHRGQISTTPGNLSYRVYASREDGSRITIVHEWEDEASFDGYQKSASFAHVGEAIQPIMVGAPVSRHFRAELLETVA
jgi:quinol monooxygenase YgiN